MLDDCTLEEVGDVTFCSFEATVDVRPGLVVDCVVEDAVVRPLCIEFDWLPEGAEDVPLDAGADGVIGWPSKSVDDVDPDIEVGCVPDGIVGLVPGTSVDDVPDCISEDESDVGSVLEADC